MVMPTTIVAAEDFSFVWIWLFTILGMLLAVLINRYVPKRPPPDRDDGIVDVQGRVEGEPTPATGPLPRYGATPPPKTKAAGKPSPGPISDSTGKSAKQVFREAFPDLKVSPDPLPAVPFAVQLVVEKEEIRVDVQGSIPVDTPAILDFVLTLEDVTGAAPERVFATDTRYQDEQTGVYVLRSTLGPVRPPGYRDRGWTALGTIRLSALQTPFSGRRTLRVTCVGMPTESATRPVASQEFRAAILCSAVASVEVEVARRGYVELRRLRERSPGTIVCLGWSFAMAAGYEPARAEAVLRRWMKAQSEQAEEGSGQGRLQMAAGLDAALALAQRGLDRSAAAAAIAAAGIPEAPRQALELCLELAVAVTGSSNVAYPLLRELALGMGVEAGEFAQIMQVSGDPEVQAWARLEAQVGLDPTWPTEKIRKYLFDQFHKWNARSASVRDTAEREEIAGRLWALAKLRQRHR